MIWEAAARQRRTIVLRTPPQDRKSRSQRLVLNSLWNRRGYPAAEDGSPDPHPPPPPPPSCHRATRRLGWTTPTPAPGMLHATRESRCVALRAYRLAFGWGRFPASVWANFDVDDVLITRDDWLGDGAEDRGRCAGAGFRRLAEHRRWRTEEAWLTTPDTAAIQRTVACGMCMEDFVAFLGTPQRSPWSLRYPERAGRPMLPALESWTAVHVQQVWRMFRPRGDDGRGGDKSAAAGASARGRQLWDRLWRHVMLVGAWGPFREEAQEKRVYLAHDSGVCRIMEPQISERCGSEDVLYEEGPGDSSLSADGLDSLMELEEFSMVLVEAFCRVDDVGRQEDLDRESIARQWTLHPKGGAQSQCSSLKSRPFLDGSRPNTSPARWARFCCIQHYAIDLEIDISSGSSR